MNTHLNTHVQNRATQDVGNLLLLEHYNVLIDDQRLATLFYVTGLGGTRDPYLMTGLNNMWVNFGRTQVHMPSPGASPQPQRLRATVGLVVPDLDELEARLAFATTEIARVMPGQAHQVAFKRTDDWIDTTCPWGNRIRCHAPSPEWGPVQLGLVYLDFDVPGGTTEGITRFYNEVMGAPAQAHAGRAVVSAGTFQSLRFTETDAPPPAYDGHHFAIYLSDFSGPYRWLLERGLISRDTEPHEWRLEWICDPLDGRRLFQVEHEVRSARHPLYNRPLVNRDPLVTNTNYAGTDAFAGRY